jgi:zinc-ribbon domain
MLACPTCGKLSDEDGRFCAACGTPLHAQAKRTQQKKECEQASKCPAPKHTAPQTQFTPATRHLGQRAARARVATETDERQACRLILAP